jgi:hypothetical protein
LRGRAKLFIAHAVLQQLPRASFGLAFHVHRLAARATQALRERQHLVARDRPVQANRHDAVDAPIDDSRRRRRDCRGGRQDRLDRFGCLSGLARGLLGSSGLASRGGMSAFPFSLGDTLGFRQTVRRDRLGLDIGRRVERRNGYARAPAKSRLDARRRRFSCRVGTHHRFAARGRPGRFDERTLLLLIVPREALGGLGGH